jgi:hypothetical protein
VQLHSFYNLPARDEGLLSGFRFLAGARYLSLLRHVQDVLGVHTAPYRFGTAFYLPGVKRPQTETEQSLLSNAPKCLLIDGAEM